MMKFFLIYITLLTLFLNPYTISAQSGKSEVWYLTTQDSVRLFVKEMGNPKGDTLVILHGGWGAEHHYLIDAFEHLLDNYRLVFYDQRGSLRSPCADSLISVGNHIHDLEELRKGLGAKRLTLAGHSMGTWLASAYLEQYPDKVNKLILCALVYPKTPSSEAEAELWKTQQKKAKVFMERPAIEQEISEEGLDHENLNDKQRTYKWRIKFSGVNLYHVERWRQVKGGQVFYSQSAGTAAGKSMPKEWDFTQIYERTGIPVYIIQGSHDFADMDGKMSKKWLGQLPNVHLHLIENAGHNIWIDQPDNFMTAIDKTFSSK